MQPFVISCKSSQKIYQILGKNLENSGTFDSFLFCFNYVTFLSFECMFNLKCNMSTDMYYFTFFVTENRVYIGECPIYFVSVIYKTNSEGKVWITLALTKPHGCRFMGFQFNLTFKIMPFGTRASRFWLMSHNLRFKLYL